MNISNTEFSMNKIKSVCLLLVALYYGTTWGDLFIEPYIKNLYPIANKMSGKHATEFPKESCTLSCAVHNHF